MEALDWQVVDRFLCLRRRQKRVSGGDSKALNRTLSMLRQKRIVKPCRPASRTTPVPRYTMLTDAAEELFADDSMVSVDFFVVPTVRFQLFYAFLVLAYERSRIVHFAVTTHPTAEWTAQQVLSTPRSPWKRAYVERVIGSIRRQCLDHATVFNEGSLNYIFKVLRLLSSKSHSSDTTKGPQHYKRTPRTWADHLHTRSWSAAPVRR